MKKDIVYFETEIIGKNKSKIEKGDIFVIKIKNNDVYFYGKVIDNNATYQHHTKSILIFIYKTPTTKIIIPEDMNENDVMTMLITDNYGWKCGHFKNICNIPVKETEENFDFGFVNFLNGCWISSEDVENFSLNHEITFLDDGRIIASPYVDAHNNKLNHKPKIFREYSYSLYETVSLEISEYLHKNPDIKKKYGLE